MFVTGAFGYLFDYLIWWALFFSLLVHTWCFFRFFPRVKYRKLGLILGNALVLACLLGALAMVGESYYRFVAVETDSFGVSLPARRWFMLNTQLNTEGFRDKQWSPIKPPGVRRIAFVGDSFSYGWGVKNVADRFPDRIQARFQQTGRGAVEVMNIGRPGWNTGTQIKHLDELLLRFDVDEVVLCYVLNDLEDLIPHPDHLNPLHPPVQVFFNLDSSPLLDHLYRTILLPREPSVRMYQSWLSSGYADPQIWGRQVLRLKHFVAICRNRGVVVRAALLPFLRVNDSMLDRASLHAQVRGVLERLGVEVVDLLPKVAGKSWRDLVVNRNDAHPNEKAHAIFANAIWNAFYASDL